MTGNVGKVPRMELDRTHRNESTSQLLSEGGAALLQLEIAANDLE